MGTSTKTKEVQTNTPPEWAAPGLSELGNRITQIIPTVPGTKYTGEFQAGANSWDPQAMAQYAATAEAAKQAGLQLGSVAPSALGGLGANPLAVSGPNAMTTPGFESYNPTAIRPVVDAALRPVQDLLTQNLSGIRSSSIDSGAYGGSRAMVDLPGLAFKQASQQAGDIATQLGYQDFTDTRSLDAATQLQLQQLAQQAQVANQGTQLNWLQSNRAAEQQGLQLYDSLLNDQLKLGAASGDLLSGNANTARGLDQAAIDNELAKFDYSIKYPFQGLDIASSLLGQLAQPWGTRTTNSTQSSGGLGSVVQGLAGGVMGASALFGNPFASVMGGGGIGLDTMLKK